MLILVCGLRSVDFVLTHLSRLVPARTGNSVLLTQQYRMFSPGGKANTKRLPCLSSFWDLTELDCSRQKDSGFWGKTLSIISCALTVVTPWHLPWKLQVLLGAEVEFDWNKCNMIVILQIGSKENFRKVCALQYQFSSCHICWCVNLKCSFVFILCSIITWGYWKCNHTCLHSCNIWVLFSSTWHMTCCSSKGQHCTMLKLVIIPLNSLSSAFFFPLALLIHVDAKVSQQAPTQLCYFYYYYISLIQTPWLLPAGPANEVIVLLFISDGEQQAEQVLTCMFELSTYFSCVMQKWGSVFKKITVIHHGHPKMLQTKHVCILQLWFWYFKLGSLLIHLMFVHFSLSVSLHKQTD